jgi:hypothetical protein
LEALEQCIFGGAVSGGRMQINLFVGGLVAVGFDKTDQFLLTVSHSGKGVFSTTTWERVAREYELTYPNEGVVNGIGPIHGQPIQVTEIDYNTGKIRVSSNDGRIILNCESDGIVVEFSE